MGEHAEYWRDLAARRVAVVLGPVSDPPGAWGMGEFRAASEDEARSVVEADPAIAKQLGTYELNPMLSAIVGAPEST